MAKRVRYILLTLADGSQKMVQSKTCTENYVRNLIADLILPCPVTKWEVLA